MKAKFGKNRAFWHKIAKKLALKYNAMTKLEKQAFTALCKQICHA